MRTELETRYTLLVRDEHGKVIDRKSVTETKFASLEEEAKEANLPAPEAEKVQTFKRYSVDTLEDFESLVPDLEERINIINRTLDIKQTDAMRELMTDEKRSTVDGTFDLAQACAAKSERKAASPIEKLFSKAGKLSQEEQIVLIAKLQALAAAVPTA